MDPPTDAAGLAAAVSGMQDDPGNLKTIIETFCYQGDNYLKINQDYFFHFVSNYFRT